MSRSESSVSSKTSNSKSSKTVSKEETPMSVPTPDYIAATETWRLQNGLLDDNAPEEFPNNNRLEQDVIRPFEKLTSTMRIAELNKILESTKHTTIDPTCIRTTSNWSSVEKHHKFDKPEFDAKKTADELAYRSPKLVKILQNIRKFDREDEARYGRKFKHFIFSDIKGAQGAKSVAAALLSDGYTLGYDEVQVPVNNTRKSNKVTKPQKQRFKTKIEVKSNSELLKTKGNNFFLLSSVSIYGEPLLVSVKKEVLQMFNKRIENVYGDLARIIVMDSGFKEGIDLFDIKYVHIFEPQTTMADQKQVIGRGTRTCGQKGLKFNPRVGWPLYVFKYDFAINPEYQVDFHGAKSSFEYYLQSKNVDIRLINLASNLENLAIKGSVDYQLNKPIHEFSADKNAVLSRGGGDSCGQDSALRKLFTGGKREEDSDDELEEDEQPPKPLIAAEENLRRKLHEDSKPGKKYSAVKKYIQKYFSEYEWPPVKMENLCGYEGPPFPPILAKTVDVRPQPLNMINKKDKRSLIGGTNEVGTNRGGAPNVIKLSPTQDFISTYFTVANPIKGMVLWQSVGTGKTCTAIATATRQFEPLGYTILWVTRTTLKNDIWKNMFDMVCHEGIRDKIEAGVRIPNDMPGKMRLLSKSWGVRPISYKQFSNLVSKNNQYYDQLVKRNGEEDPLRKTLIIIDEAHKLYGGGDLSSIERPDMPAFHQALMKSYAVSGKDSVRVLFMTATPITENPLELVKLVNLCRPAEQQIPTEFDEFADTFLDDTGDFTKTGKKMFLDRIAGHISYLNREGDVRQFARPILREVAVPLVNEKTAKDIADFDVVGASILDKKAEELRSITEDAKSKYDAALKGFTKGNMDKVGEVCSEYPEEDRNACYKFAKKSTTKMLRIAKERAKVWKDHMTDVGKEWRDAKKVKSDKFRFVRQTRKDNEDDFNEYKQSAYYKLKECEKEWKDTKNLDQFLETQPVYSQAKDLEDVVKDELANVEIQLKSDISSQQKRIKSYNNLLKTDLAPIEARVVRMNIADATTKLNKSKKRNQKWLKRMTKRANASIEQLEKFQKKAKTEIRKVIKEQMREDKQFEKEEKKEMKMADTADADLTDTFRDSLKDAQDDVRIEMNMRKTKMTNKNEKKTAAATRKAQKEAEKMEREKANATRKQRVALEKEEKKAQKDALKDSNKAQKEAEKTRLAQEKKAQNEAEKARLAQEKKVQKEAAKSNKKAK